MLTVNGRVRVRRIRWSAPGDCQTPIDRSLDAAERTFSRGVHEMLCRLNQCSSCFRKVAENAGRLANLSISHEMARQIIEGEGRAVAEAMRRGRLNYGWTASDCVVSPDSSRKRVYVGCDGVLAPMVTDAEKRKRRQTIKKKRQQHGKRLRPLPRLQPGTDQAFKELRIVTAYDEPQQHRAVAVTRGDCEVTGRQMRTLAVTLRLDQADESIANIDGAPWIRNQLELHQPTRAIGLDFYHLKDYAQPTRREVYGEHEPAGATWLDQLLKTLLEQGVAAAWESLLAWRGGLRGRKRVAADALLGYIAERREIIRYREFRDSGWQIGSGPTEAQCKSTTRRVKGRGRRWDLRHAEEVMALAALESSGIWKRWFTTSTPAAA